MSLHVLVVDDSAVMRRMIIRSLRISGLPIGEVHEAADGAAALEVMRAHWIDLLLADLNMPRMGGEEMIRRLRADELTRDVAVVVVSSEGSEARLETLRASTQGFVRKPFAPEDLRAAVEAAIRPAGGGAEEGGDA